MPDLPYTVRVGQFTGVAKGTVPEWSAHAPGYLHADYHQVCLVVTGNVVAADRRLAGPSDATVELAARAIWDVNEEANGDGMPFEELTDDQQEWWRRAARAAFAVAEEATGG